MSAGSVSANGRRPVLVGAFLLVTALFVGMLYSGAYGEGKVSAPGCPSSGPGSGPGGSFPGSGPGGSFPGSGPGSLPGSAPGGSCPGVSGPGSEPGSEPQPPPPPCPPHDDDKPPKDKPPKDKPPKDKDGDGCPDKDEDKGHDGNDDDHGNDDHGNDDHGDHGEGDDHGQGGRPARGGVKPVPGQSLRDVLRRGLKVELTCPAACRAQAGLLVTTHVRASRASRKGVGTGDRRLRRAGKTVFAVKVTRRWRARFRRAKSVKLTLRTLVTSAGGDSVRNRRITLRR